MTTPAQAWLCPGPYTSSWDGNMTLTVASSQPFAKFSGQCYANLATPLPGWPQGNPT